MPKPFSNIPEDVLKSAASGSESGKKTGAPANKKPSGSGLSGQTEGTKQRGPFKKKRAGVVLTKEQVKEIKEGRKKLRKDLRAQGIRGKRDFEATAASLGLYFDKRRNGIIPFLLSHWLGFLIAALLVLLLILFIFAMITQLQGHFTVNLSGPLFREGFTLSETVGFENPTTRLFAQAAEDIPCVSIKDIPGDIDLTDGQHNADYFAFTFYIRNEGEKTAGYTWSLDISSESQDLSEGAWVMLFEDGVPVILAAPNKTTGQPESLPPKTDNSRGYLNLPFANAYGSNPQLETVKQTGSSSYLRVNPENFESKSRLRSGLVENVEPGEKHKYTVVMWLEGDDPDTDNSMIGGHLGVEFSFRMTDEPEEESPS
ncbi:MAG: hypothetical protein ILO68_00295, partial [Clostridia bacterium]|nr:hypothetical protein [Clostridia bacterium]